MEKLTRLRREIEAQGACGGGAQVVAVEGVTNAGASPHECRANTDPQRRGQHLDGFADANITDLARDMDRVLVHSD